MYVLEYQVPTQSSSMQAYFYHLTNTLKLLEYVLKDYFQHILLHAEHLTHDVLYVHEQDISMRDCSKDYQKQERFVQH